MFSGISSDDEILEEEEQLENYIRSLYPDPLGIMDADADLDAVAQAKSVGDALQILCPDMKGVPTKCRGKYQKRRFLEESEKNSMMRQQNRENARRTRIRRKIFSHFLSKAVDQLEALLDPSGEKRNHLKERRDVKPGSRPGRKLLKSTVANVFPEILKASSKSKSLDFRNLNENSSPSMVPESMVATGLTVTNSISAPTSNGVWNLWSQEVINILSSQIKDKRLRNFACLFLWRWGDVQPMDLLQEICAEDITFSHPNLNESKAADTTVNQKALLKSGGSSMGVYSGIQDIGTQLLTRKIFILEAMPKRVYELDAAFDLEEIVFDAEENSMTIKYIGAMYDVGPLPEFGDNNRSIVYLKHVSLKPNSAEWKSVRNINPDLKMTAYCHVKFDSDARVRAYNFMYDADDVKRKINCLNISLYATIRSDSTSNVRKLLQIYLHTLRNFLRMRLSHSPNKELWYRVCTEDIVHTLSNAGDRKISPLCYKAGKTVECHGLLAVIDDSLCYEKHISLTVLDHGGDPHAWFIDIEPDLDNIVTLGNNLNRFYVPYLLQIFANPLFPTLSPTTPVQELPEHEGPTNGSPRSASDTKVVGQHELIVINVFVKADLTFADDGSLLMIREFFSDDNFTIKLNHQPPSSIWKTLPNNFSNFPADAKLTPFAAKLSGSFQSVSSSDTCRSSRLSNVIDPAAVFSHLPTYRDNATSYTNKTSMPEISPMFSYKFGEDFLSRPSPYLTGYPPGRGFEEPLNFGRRRTLGSERIWSGYEEALNSRFSLSGSQVDAFSRSHQMPMQRKNQMDLDLDLYLLQQHRHDGEFRNSRKSVDELCCQLPAFFSTEAAGNDGDADDDGVRHKIYRPQLATVAKLGERFHFPSL